MFVTILNVSLVDILLLYYIAEFISDDDILQIDPFFQYH